MSRGLKITFLIHAIVALVFGLLLYVRPGLWVRMVDWTPYDVNMTRTYGAALLALAVSSWFGYRAVRWEEVRILVLMEIALTVLSTIGGLWGLLFRGAPVFGWVSVLIWVVFAVAWIYFYVNRPAEA
jgi:hypothetical protein